MAYGTPPPEMGTDSRKDQVNLALHAKRETWTRVVPVPRDAPSKSLQMKSICLSGNRHASYNCQSYCVVRKIFLPMRSPVLVLVLSFRYITKKEAAFPALHGSCRSQRMPRIWLRLLSSSTQRRICPALYFVGAPCS